MAGVASVVIPIAPALSSTRTTAGIRHRIWTCDSLRGGLSTGGSSSTPLCHRWAGNLHTCAERCLMRRGRRISRLQLHAARRGDPGVLLPSAIRGPHPCGCVSRWRALRLKGPSLPPRPKTSVSTCAAVELFASDSRSASIGPLGIAKTSGYLLMQQTGPRTTLMLREDCTTQSALGIAGIRNR